MISAITPNFQGRRDNIDALINMDDNTIRQIAIAKTEASGKAKRNNRVTNALFYSAPLAAGLGAALLSKGGNVKIFSKEVSGVAARFAKGLSVTAGFTAILGLLDGLGFAKRKLAEKSPEVRKFDRENPLLSMATMLAAGIGTVMLANKGLSKLAEKEAPKFLQRGTEKVANFFNENKMMVGLKNKYLRLVEKTPSSLREIGATALDWAPTALLFGGLFHSIGSAGAQNREFAKNYNEIKEKQELLTKARLQELQVENDFFKLDPQNREDIALLNDPLQGIAEELAE